MTDIFLSHYFEDRIGVGVMESSLIEKHLNHVICM